MDTYLSGSSESWRGPGSGTDAEFGGIRVGDLVRVRGTNREPMLVVCREFAENSLGEGDMVYWIPRVCVVLDGKKVWMSTSALEPVSLTA